MIRWMARPLVPALASAVFACGDTRPDPNDPLAQLTAVANQLEKAAEGLGTSRKPVPPVAFRELIDFLPRDVAGLKRKEPKGETTAAGSWRYSQAEVDFASGDGRRSADVGIFDYAHIPFLYVPFTMLLNMQVSTESTEGYQRSTKVAGYPAFEKWNRDGTGEAVVLVGERFVVKAETRGLAEGAARKIVEKMKLKELASKGS
jgi:hypothetical protein